MNLTGCLFWGRISSQTTQEYYFHRKGVISCGGSFYAPGQESKFRCKSFVLTSSECNFSAPLSPKPCRQHSHRENCCLSQRPLPYLRHFLKRACLPYEDLPLDRQLTHSPVGGMGLCLSPENKLSDLLAFKSLILKSQQPMLKAHHL